MDPTGSALFPDVAYANVQHMSNVGQLYGKQIVEQAYV